MKKKCTIIIVFFLATTIGLCLARMLNAFLAIKISEKKLPKLSEQEIGKRYPALAFRMVDMGGVGIDVDKANWGKDYSHNIRRFEKVFLKEEPFINPIAFDNVYQDFCHYIDRMSDLGFNAIEIPGFLEFIDFKGYEIYSQDSLYPKRHAVLRHFYKRFFDYASQKGMQCILYTDMVAINSALKLYFKKHLGGMDVEREEFWQVYQRGLEEAFDYFPQVKGIIIRIGEAGAVYNRPGYDYGSELLVRTASSVKKMLRSFLQVAESRQRYIIFRTWSVGVGEIGHMHTNPHVYEKVLGDLHSEWLIVSTKFCKGDYWSHLPLNPTLLTGKHKRIIEFQARREFEAFNVTPNYIAPLHHYALANFLKANKNIYGAWVWSQSGGPLRQGPMMTYPFHGLWLWTDANVYATARIAADPGCTLKEYTEDWVKNTFGKNSQVVQKMTQLLLMSHETLASGLTIPAFAKKYVTGMGLEVPPVIYCYWDFLESSTSIGSHIYFVAKKELPEAIREAFSPVEQTREMKKILASVEPEITQGKEWLPLLKKSLEYQESLLETLAYHKEFLLYFYRWIDEGDSESLAKWNAAQMNYTLVQKSHYQRHQHNLDFPAYNFEMSDECIKQASMSSLMIWSSRLLLLLILLFIYYKTESALLSLGMATIFIFIFLGIFSSFAAPVFTMSLGILASFYLAGLYFFFRSSSPFHKILLPVLASVALVLSILSIRGPFYLWYNFWTSDIFRIFLCIVLSIILFWHLYILFTLKNRYFSFSGILSRLCLLIGSIVCACGMVFCYIGMEKTLSVLNDELLLVPGITSRVLGITTHLNMPENMPYFILISGSVLFIVGTILILVQHKDKYHLSETPGFAKS
ncbi:MAG: hypothetical protein HUU50_16910 [Candidatus Brocadiae bacterium]|nr:hypothetical protein [Candidatus Brocadiia bacterium]